MTLESDIYSLVQKGILAQAGADDLLAAIRRERAENKACPLADHFETQISRAASNPNRAINILLPLLQTAQKRNDHFGE